MDNFLSLSNGNKMPLMGLGTDDVFFINPPHKGKNIITKKIWSLYNRQIKKPLLDNEMTNKFVSAIKSGYRLIDSSSSYRNEKSIGCAVKKSGVPRDQMFLTTRCTNRAQYDGTIREEFMKSLQEFGTNYIDLYMFHWPVTGHFLDTWKVMEELYEEGLVKNLGFANCHQHHIEDILQQLVHHFHHLQARIV